jgi:hypothetical protein
MNTPAIKDYSKLSTPDLHARLKRSLEASAAGLYEAAAIWSELNRRGEAPSASGIMQWLRRIATGELAAEAVVSFAGQDSLLIGLVGMPLDQQRKYAAGEAITVATFDADGGTVTEEKPLLQLSAREVKLAIDRGQVRPVKAQINSLKRSRTASKTTPHYSTVTVQADLVAGVLVVGHARVSPSELAVALRSLGWRLERIVAPRRAEHHESQKESRL